MNSHFWEKGGCGLSSAKNPQGSVEVCLPLFFIFLGFVKILHVSHRLFCTLLCIKHNIDAVIACFLILFLFLVNYLYLNV